MKNLSIFLIFWFGSIELSGQSENSITLKHKPPIDKNAIVYWKSFGFTCEMSPDGKYFMYSFSDRKMNGKTLVIQSTDNTWKQEFAGIADFDPGSFFTSDSKQAVFFKEDTINFLTLGSSVIKVIPDVEYKIPSKKGKWIAYSRKNSSHQLILHNLITSEKKVYSNVRKFAFDNNSKVLLLIVGDGNGVDSVCLNWVDLTSRTLDGIRIWSSLSNNEAPGEFEFDRLSRQLTFTVHDKMAGKSIWYYKSGGRHAVIKASRFSEVINDDLEIEGAPKFSYNSKYIFFLLTRKLKKIARPSNDAVMVNIWSYKESIIQPEQSQRLNNVKTFQAVISVDTEKLIQIEHDNEGLRTPPRSITGDYAVISDQEFVEESWWKLDRPSYIYAVNLKTGERRTINENGSGNSCFSLSPSGQYIVYWDAWKSAYFSYSTSKNVTVNISGKIGHRISKDYINSVHYQPISSTMRWMIDESAMLVYDNYDIWKLDPAGLKGPINVTNGYGRKNKIKLRIVFENRDCDLFLNGSEVLLLTGFNSITKYNGFFHMRLNHLADPVRLTFGPYNYYRTESQEPHSGGTQRELLPLSSSKKSHWIIQRHSASEAPNYFLTTNFKEFRQLTYFEPQKEYNWLTTELINWKMFDGRTSQGILYKPEDFDSTKKYPIIFTYYEALSHRLFDFIRPTFTPDNISIPWFVSRGYLVFIPDIHYKPANTSNRTVGEWAYNSVVSSAQYLAKNHYIDQERMGLHGHSFGGLQTAYLVTHSPIFAAASEAAGSTDPISAYLTLTPSSASFDHKIKQGSIEMGHELYGATPWERPDLYLKNSAVLNAHKVLTPLLIMHNLNDDQIPGRQGVELYMALRRLHKVSWLLQYDHGKHNLRGKDAVDYNIRVTQFFDHYLKSAPAPKWMTQGIPAKLKGVISGYGLDPSGNCGKDCKVCNIWNKKWAKDSVATKMEIEEKTKTEHWMGSGN